MSRGDRLLRGAALGFAGAAVHGSVVSARYDVPGEPAGLRLALPVPAGLLVGWGAGVAAPWPMPVLALRVTGRTGPVGRSRAWVCAVLGLGCLIGTAVEPVTRGRRPSDPAIRRAIVCNVVASVAMVGAAAVRLVADARDGGGGTTTVGAG